MGNVLYDIDPSYLGLGPSYIQPYVGVGAGYVWTQFRNLRGVSGAPGAVNGVRYPGRRHRPATSPPRASSASPRRSPGSGFPA